MKKGLTTTLRPMCVLLALTFVVGLGCGSGTRSVKPVKQEKITRTTLATETAKADLDGLSIAVFPISIGQMKDHDELTVPVGRNFWAIGGGPCFKLQISNSNEHIIKLREAVIKLADSQGNLYDVMTKRAMIGRQQSLISETAQKYGGDPAGTQALQESVAGRIEELRLFEPDATILPGFMGVFYLFFDLPRSSQATAQVNAEWLQKRGPFKLMVFDVVTKTDEAGNVARKTKYEWLFNTRTVEETYEDGKLVGTTEPSSGDSGR